MRRSRTSRRMCRGVVPSRSAASSKVISLSILAILPLLGGGHGAKFLTGNPSLPVVAVVLGIVFLGEPAAAHLLIGTGIVLVGIALVQRRTPAPASTPEASTQEREP